MSSSSPRVFVEGNDAHWAPETLPPSSTATRSVGKGGAAATALRQSLLVRTKDGTLIAIDVLLPAAARVSSWGGARRDVVFTQHRYGRAWRTRKWLRPLLWGGAPVDLINFEFVSAWLAAGCAVVSADVRGCGASSGVWRRAWSDEELSDSLEVLDWIVAQPWCSGRIALAGQSYDANAAIRTACARHPAVTCCVAVAPFLDLFDDIGYPGGVSQHQFLNSWSGLVAAFDSQSLGAAPGASALLALAFRGVARASLPPLDQPSTNGATFSPAHTRATRAAERARGRAALAAALAERRGRSWSPRADVPFVAFADDVAPGAGCSCADMAVSQLLPAIRRCGVPFLFTSGWFDATVRSAAVAFAAAAEGDAARCGSGGGGARSRLVVGPWTHIPWSHEVLCGAPGRGCRPTAFPLPAETARFILGAHAAGAAAAGGGSAPPPLPAAEPPVRLFECGAGGAWAPFPSWPTASTSSILSFALAPGRSLALLPPAPPPSPPPPPLPLASVGRAAVPCAARPATIGWSRWQAMLQIGRHVRYASFPPLRFVSEPLPSDVRLCGSPLVTLHVRSSDGVADIHAFLCVIQPGSGGRLKYLSEGCLRSTHRKECGGGGGDGDTSPDGDATTNGSGARGDNNTGRVDSAPQHAPALPVRPLPQAAPRLPRHTFARADASPPLPPPVPDAAPPPAAAAAFAASQPLGAVRFALLPLFVRVPKGARLALALSGADSAHYTPTSPEAASRVMQILWPEDGSAGERCGGGGTAALELPLLPRS